MLKLLLESATWDLLPGSAAPPPEPPTDPSRAGARARPRRATGPSAPSSTSPRRPSRSPTRGLARARARHARRPPGGRARGRAAPDGRPAPGRRPRGGAGRPRARRDGRRAHRRRRATSSDPIARRRRLRHQDLRARATRPSPTRSPPTQNAANRYPIVRVRKAVKLLDAPGGRVQGEDRRQDGVQVDAHPLGGQAPRRMARGARAELDNGEVAWMHQDHVRSPARSPWSMHVDLSKRRPGGSQGRREHAHGADRHRPPRPSRRPRGASR